jgi:hypothetical protein
VRFLPFLALLAFTVYCLIDVVRSEDTGVRGLPKLVWVGLVLVFPLAGGIAWFVAGRPRGSRPMGVDRIGRAKPRVLGPDDDPDFLRTIDRPRPITPPGPLDGTGSEGTGQGQDPPKNEHDEHDDPTGQQDDRRQ